MANSTTFLPVAAYNHIEGKTIVASNTIDFSKEPTASGDTIDVLHIPKGAFVKRAGLVVHTTEASVTIEVGESGDADEFLTAQTLTSLKADNNAGTADGGVMSVDAAQKFYGAADTLRLTVGGATADTAIVTAFVEYFIVPKSRAV
jgi:hypothetical protein